MKLISRFVLLICLAFTASAYALEPAEAVKPGKKDKCPVCGMFVAKYPHWVGEIIYDDGTVYFFDGAKDLFKFYFSPSKFKSDKRQQNIQSIYVTEYYYSKLFDAKTAYYVIGSDVYGPMGRELIPFASEPDAQEFAQDHQGKQIVQFKDVTPELIATLD